MHWATGDVVTTSAKKPHPEQAAVATPPLHIQSRLSRFMEEPD
jgi:hypothetical protein